MDKEKQQTESPYITAKREWNERYGSYITRAKQWRLAALGSITVATICAGGLVAVSLQTKVVPYAVEFNKNDEVVKVRRVDALTAPNANQVRASLRTWLIGARSVFSDQDAIKTRLDETYALTLHDSAAYTKLVNFQTANNPYNRAAQGTVHIDVVSIVPVSGNDWQIEWNETTYDGSGKMSGTQQWQAMVDIVISPPTNTQQIMVNPLGVYVKDFEWTNRLTTNEGVTK